MTRDAAGMSGLSLGAAALGLLIAAGAAAQTPGQTGNTPGNPPMTAPMIITAPPIPPPAARHDSDRGAPDRAPPPREDGDSRNQLGAPTFVQPGAVATPYAAPQNPYSVPPSYAAPAYGPGGNPAVRPGCRQYAPAYDEAGRFLANVCVR